MPAAEDVLYDLGRIRTVADFFDRTFPVDEPSGNVGKHLPTTGQKIDLAITDV